MATTERRFIVTDVNGNTRQIYPVNFNQGKYTYNLEENQVFRRKKYTGKLQCVKTNGDYAFFHGYENNPSYRCARFTLSVERKCGGVWVQEYSGKFSVGQGFWDKDNCRFEVKLETYDKYSCLLDNGETEVNILDLEDRVNTLVPVDPGFEYAICRDDSPINGPTCALTLPEPTASWKQLYDNSLTTPEDDEDYIMVWIREFAVVQCIGGSATPPSGSGWMVDIDDCAGDGTVRYVRQPLQSWVPTSNKEVQAGWCDDGDVYEPPPLVRKAVDVSLSGPVTVNDVIGPVNVGEGIGIVELYTVVTPTNSTVKWIVFSDPGLAVASITGDTTTQLQVTYTYSGSPTTVILQCVEATICGHEVTHEITVTVDASTTPLNEYVIEGLETVCPDSAPVTYELPFEYRMNIDGIIGITYSNLFFTEISSTPYSITLQPTGVEGDTDVRFTIPTRHAQSVVVIKPVEITTRVLTPAIRGLSDNMCNTATGVLYEVDERPGSSYEWMVDGGTIMADNGHSIVVDWQDNETHRVRLKETVSCGCQWILLSATEDNPEGCGPNGEPPYFWCYSGAYVTYSNTLTLQSVIEYVVQQSGCEDINLVRSDLFNWNAIGDAPGYVAGQNYVTGSPNHYDYLTIAQKSDAKDPLATNPATRGIITFLQLMDYLRIMFNVYWDVTAGTLRIEHISYFETAMGLDLTLPEYEKEVKKFNKYQYIGEERPRYERFKWMEAKNQDFIGAEIRYQSPCVSTEGRNQVKEYAADRITTDLDYINTSPEEIADDGFVIYATTLSGGNYIVVTATGVLSGDSVVNAPMSWANLHDAFHRHNRYFPVGYLNEEETDFESYQMTVRQDKFSVGMCCEFLDFDPALKIKTYLGEHHFNGTLAVVDKCEYNLEKNTVELTLGYPR